MHSAPGSPKLSSRPLGGQRPASAVERGGNNTYRRNLPSASMMDRSAKSSPEWSVGL